MIQPYSETTQRGSNMAELIRSALAILRRKKVEKRTGLSKSTIYDRLDIHSPRYDPDFPKPVHLGGHAVGWIESEIEAWLELQIARRSAASLQAQVTQVPQLKQRAIRETSPNTGKPP